MIILLKTIFFDDVNVWLQTDALMTTATRFLLQQKF